GQPSLLLGWGCIAGPRGTKAQEPGTPLSDQEYHQFFQFLRITIQARTACELRELYGCKNSLVQRLDEYENHGAIPPGKASRDSQGQESCMALITGKHSGSGEEKGGERGG
uniref:Acrosin-binding protein n=1 Tax=Junco hyemalis TaxID=40217 RepID=A0A8C5IZF4_JUNHY